MTNPTLEQLLAQARSQPPVIAVGNFDGVHLGHRAILTEAIRRAAQLDTVARVLTFEPHPVTYFGKRSVATFRLTGPRHKSDLLNSLGAGGPIVLPFEPELFQMTPFEFARRVLFEGLDAREVWVGYDFNFGQGRVGTSEDLRRFGAQLGFSVEVHQAVELDGDVVSSTRIRKALAAGDLDDAARCLGRPHALRGVVVTGAGRGRTMGFPTLNLVPAAGLMVPYGVYATRIRDLSQPATPLLAVTNIGVRPTVEASATPNVESFLLEGPNAANFTGVELEVELLAYLRPEQKFDNLDELKDQIRRDAERAKAIHLNSVQETSVASTSTSSGSS